MSEGGDYCETSWAPSYDYSTARKVHTEEAAHSYQKAEEKGTKDWDLLPESITTQAENALILVNDDTGSMSSWPITFRSKAPFMIHEVQMYLSEDTDVAFCAYGDAYENERFPLQVRPFCRGQNEYTVKLGELVHVKGGGDGVRETAELAALYIARNVHTPNTSRKPIVIFTTDENPYAEVPIGKARDVARVTIKKALTTKEVFEELTRKFSVYLILKPLGNSSYQTRITQTWEDLVGADRIAHLADETRAVDVTLGILAHYSGKIEEFKAELNGRQNPDQVRVVMAALHDIFANTVSDGRSIMHDMDEGGEDVGSL